MLKGVLNKGLMKYTFMLVILALLFFSMAFILPRGSGEGATDSKSGDLTTTMNDEHISLEIMDFQEIESQDSQTKSNIHDVQEDTQEIIEEKSTSSQTAHTHGHASGGGGGCRTKCKPPSCCEDKDGDGYSVKKHPWCGCGEIDCDDNDPEVNPGADEICDNGKDDDCDGMKDCEDSDCDEDPACTVYCDPKSPGYWKNHLEEAESLLDCVHEADIFDYVENQDDIEFVLDCSGDCSNMLNKLKKFLLATILNVCGGYFDLDDTFGGETIEYWIEHAIEEVENGESEGDEYYKDALDNIVNGGVECYPEYHTECNETYACILVEGEGENECVSGIDCIPPYLEVDKDAEPDELICEEARITLTVSGEGNPYTHYYPIDVVLVFDRSGSMDDDGWDPEIHDWQPIGDAKLAAKTFIDLLGGNDRAGLVSFATKANLDEPLTFDHEDVKDAMGGMHANGWTNMSEAINLANQELVGNGRMNVTWIEILLSDGNNNCGMKNPPEDCHQRVFARAEEAKDNGIIIYTIALGENANRTLMEKIANITGGGYYYAPSSEDLEEIYEEIAEEVTTFAGTEVVVYDYLPPYVELNQSSLPEECEYNESERKIRCELGTINVNETVTIEFSVYLYQLGYNLTNVYPDSGVSYVDYEGTNQFVPFPETYVTVHGFDGADEICDDGYDNDCDGYVDWEDPDCRHDVCNYTTLTCENVPEYVGGDACETDEDCYHMVCDYVGEACTLSPGEGEDECETYDDCFHRVCNYEDLICEEIASPGEDECNTFVPDCGECDDDSDCDYLDNDYCEGDKVMHVEGVCVEGVCETSEPQEIEDCDDYDQDYCDGDLLKHDEGYCSEGMCEVETSVVEDCYYHLEYCDGDRRMEETGFCNENVTACDYVTDEIENCADNNYEMCDDIYYKVYHTETCEEVCGDTQCVPSTEVIDCRDGLWCNGDETCSEEGGVHCEPGTPVSCDDSNECTYDECVEDGENQGHCEYENKPYGTWCGEWRDCPDDECVDPYKYFYPEDGHDYCDGEGNCLVYSCDSIGYECDVDCGAGCEEDGDCPDSECSETYYDYCSGHKLVEYDDDRIMDSTTVTDSCENSCTDTCECTECEVDCSPPETNTYCVKGVCGAECEVNEDCVCPEDGCVGTDWYDYPDHGECTDDCMCDVSEEPCSGPCKPSITYNDPRCTHLVCDYEQEACVIAEGDGEDECETWDDCVHYICDYSTFTCEERPINEERDECETDEDCYEKVCDYETETCKKVEPGTPGILCETYDDCVHTECNYEDLVCETVLSPGVSECSTFEDCPQHRVCDYEQEACVIAEGEGEDECETWDDCLFCGDGEVTPPEECELPGTDNNSYCVQTTTECLGYKLGTRDAYGYCDEECGCVEDPFVYSCVKGECGAECERDMDCESYCEGDMYYYSGTCDTQTNCSCSYLMEDCNSYDGCYAYESGCEERDYYCSEEGCNYTYSNRNTDYYDCPVLYCLNDEIRQHELFHDFYCDLGCEDHTSWTNDELVEDCNSYDGWYETNERQWVEVDECNEKEERKEEYRDYYCYENGDVECEYEVTDYRWVETGNTRYKPDGTPCDDGLWCTEGDVCIEGSCTGEEKDCSDGVVCTVDTCDEANDTCVHTPDDSFCDDGLYCNGYEYCDPELDCQPGTPINCSYLDSECGEGFCNEESDRCELDPYPLSTPCEADGNLCTLDHCDGYGNCVTYDEVTCPEDTECRDYQGCDPDTGLCIYTDMPLSTPCEADGDVCTVDHCDGKGNCVYKEDLNCSDSNECTYDHCDPFSGCYWENKPYGTWCGEWRDCPDDECVDPYKYFYPEDGHDYCDGEGNCLVYSCDSIGYECDVDCGAGCEEDGDCPDSECSETYYDYCSGHKLVEYDDDRIMDSTTVTDSCENSCTDTCECTECEVDCSPPETNTYCVKGVCGAECEVNEDCVCPEDGCVGTDWYDYPEHTECSDTCECSECEPTISICDPRCMGDCRVRVYVKHVMNPKWPDPNNPRDWPYTVTDDIAIVVEDVSGGACEGLTIPVRYWQCSCPNKDPEQSAIEYYVSPPKYDRLCTANAAGEDNPTHSLGCSPCKVKSFLAKFTNGKTKVVYWTGVGSCEGTFQIDVRDYYDCYERGGGISTPPALGCAGHCEDEYYPEPPTHFACADMACVRVSGNGIDECGSDEDCYYYACDYSQQACIKKAGTQADECSTWSECVHTECNYETMTCDIVNSPGTNECSSDSDCEVYHMECVGFKCTSVLGPGPNECSSDLDCEGPLP